VAKGSSPHRAEGLPIVGSPGSRFGRRAFLRGSAGGLALLALGAVLPAGCTRYPKPRPKLRFFTAKEYAILNLLAARILGVEALAAGAAEGGVDVAGNLDRIVLGWDADLRRQLRFALRVVEHGTYLFDLKRKRFTKLTVEEQDRYLAGWAGSTLGARRVAFLAIKALVSLGYYAEEWTGLGYPGPWLGRVEVAPA
jgi:hypothetical protein